MYASAASANSSRQREAMDNENRGTTPRSLVSNNSNINNNNNNTTAIVSAATLQHQQQWTNLTPFPYQRDIARAADALGLNRRFGFLQDRVVFFRPNLKRKCPNGIMTDRVAFVTPNGMLHLCDNDAAPKRTLALTELLSVVTDSVSQIALVTDWPLVLRFEFPRFSGALPTAVQQLPTIKNLISLAKFFRPNASLLRCTPEDFATVNFNLGKPRQFRVPTSFEALQPPPDKSIDAMLEEQRLQLQRNNLTPGRPGNSGNKPGEGADQAGKDGKDGNLLNKMQQRLNSIRTGVGAAAGVGADGDAGSFNNNYGSPKRSVQFSQEPPSKVIFRQDDMNNNNNNNVFPSSPSPNNFNNNNNNNNQAMMSGRQQQSSSPSQSQMIRDPSDFFAAQQAALLNHYGNNGNSSSQNFSPSFYHGGNGKEKIASDEYNNNNILAVNIDPKIDKVLIRPEQLEQNRRQREAQLKLEQEKAKQLAEEQQRQNQDILTRLSSSNNTPTNNNYGRGQSVSQSGNGAGGDGFYNNSTSLGNENNANNQRLTPRGVTLASNSRKASIPPRLQEDPRYSVEPQQNQGAGGTRSVVVPLSSQLFDYNNNNNNNQAQNHHDLQRKHFFFATLPDRFEGRTSDEVLEAIRLAQEIEAENERLRNEVLALELRERRMRGDPIPLGRVLPADAALAGAATRNLGVLVISICKRRKLLGLLDSTIVAQRQLIEGESMIASGSGHDDDGGDMTPLNERKGRPQPTSVAAAAAPEKNSSKSSNNANNNNNSARVVPPPLETIVPESPPRAANKPASPIADDDI